MLSRIQNNNPMEYLVIDDDLPVADWSRLGIDVANHSSLSYLRFLSRVISEEDIIGFFSGVALNTSINRLYFRECNLYDGKVFDTLIPFFQNNPHLMELGLETPLHVCIKMLTV